VFIELYGFKIKDFKNRHHGVNGCVVCVWYFFKRSHTKCKWRL